ncbi:large-conductance mechanosensitive channel protein MscL [Maribellus sediminis]|uniref:large-conductance mechanosensitive channel protein MscL n=1 Tax=Maribellus sediminis TaxID=2696285 RepID=UPI00142F474A|nr:large-conductance mechanosensitive channel protein MscL [Maribellus sediminis]
MKLLKEFKAFIMKGNVLDLAVAVIIATAFKAIVTSFVKDVLMPPIGMLLGGVDFADLKLLLKEGSEAVMNGDQVVTPAVSEVAISYGLWINTMIDFVIIAFAIFIIIKAYNKTQKKEEEAPAPPPAPSTEEVLLTEIRDILKEKK